MAALYRKPHYSEARYNEVELYILGEIGQTSNKNLPGGTGS